MHAWTLLGREPGGPTDSHRDGAEGRLGKAMSHNPDAYVRGKSDGCGVPEKRPNKGGQPPPAEAVEGRQPTKGNSLGTAASRTQSRTRESIGLQRVREVKRFDAKYPR